jgi:hypothetical protein
MSLTIKTIRTFFKNKHGRLFSFCLSILSFNIFVYYTIFRTINLVLSDPELLAITFEFFQNAALKLEDIPSSFWVAFSILGLFILFFGSILLFLIKLNLKTSLIYSFLVDLSNKTITKKQIREYAAKAMFKILGVDLCFWIFEIFIFVAFVGFNVYNFVSLTGEFFIIQGENIELSEDFAKKLLFFYVSVFLYILSIWLYRSLTAVLHNYSYIFAIMSKRSVFKSISAGLRLYSRNFKSIFKTKITLRIIIILANLLVALFVWLTNRYLIQTNLKMVLGDSVQGRFLFYFVFVLFYMLIINFSTALVKSLKLSYYRELFIKFYR